MPQFTSEDDLQSAIVQEWRARGVPGSVLTAIPNGGRRDLVTAARLKRQGVLAGIPDLFACGAGGLAFIELKNPAGKSKKAETLLSDAQRDIIPKLKANGVTVHVTSNFAEVCTVLEGLQVLRLAR